MQHKSWFKALFVGALAIVSIGVVVNAAEPIIKIIPSGAKLYITGENGFDTYLVAALKKKKVPVVVVADKTQADFELSGVADHEKPGWAKVLVSGNIHSDEQASVKLINIKTSEVVFAYAVNKKNTVHGTQTTAEACAKHLKDYVME
jgi:hypothetical protein